MELDEMLTNARDAMTVRRVFADPYEKDGATIIAGAAIAGGGGGGSGHDKDEQEGEGGGFGVRARPAGAFVISGGKVDWRPAVDVNRMIAVAGAVLVAYLLARIPARVARARRRWGAKPSARAERAQARRARASQRQPRRGKHRGSLRAALHR